MPPLEPPHWPVVPVPLLRALVGRQRVAAAAARLGLAARALAAEVGSLAERRAGTGVAVVAADRLAARAVRLTSGIGAARAAAFAALIAELLPCWPNSLCWLC